jgi:aldose 1-epimerase
MPVWRPRIDQSAWGNFNGENIYLFTLTNKRGDIVSISNYGGTILSWMTRDKNDQLCNIVLGFDKLNDYITSRSYFGTLVGRYANRIGGAKFKIGNHTYFLTSNDGENHCHGGHHGFDKVVWKPSIENSYTPVLHLSYVSKDGEEGYPGNLIVKVTYSLKEDGLAILYRAETDKPTIINLTNHSYFNLTGERKNSVSNHKLTLDADAYTPVDSELIPSGEILSLKQTVFDFRNEKTIGHFFDSSGDRLDHNFVLNQAADRLIPCAILREPISRRRLDVFTTEPGLQVYSGSDDKSSGYNSICLETQHFPNSPNQPNFPSTLLIPGEFFKSSTYYRICIE